MEHLQQHRDDTLKEPESRVRARRRRSIREQRGQGSGEWRVARVDAGSDVAEKAYSHSANQQLAGRNAASGKRQSDPSR